MHSHTGTSSSEGAHQDLKRLPRHLIHHLGIDEAALMSPYQIRFLISRVRLGGWKPKQMAP